MRMTTSALVAGAATAVFALEDQKVLGNPGSQPHHDLGVDIDSGAWTESLQDLFGDASEGIREIWDEVRPFIPDGFASMKKQLEGHPPKPATRRPDSEWDHIVQGSDLHDVFIETDGKSHRKFDGKLDTYTLRARSVDPSELGLDDVKQYSGYLDDNENDKHLFYWFFESRNDPKNDPVVLWLNGGPGCSSLLGLLFELGPSSIDKNIKPVYNPSAWNSNASVIFLDQPVNVGYSYGSGTVSNTAAAGRDVYALLTLFFDQFPQYAKQDFHIAGESYGGHYVPIFASEIMSHENRNINLKSIMVGNGLTDAYEQYPAYPPMACGKGGYDAVLDEGKCRSMENAIPRCQSLIKNCYDSESAWSCVPAFIYCNNALIGPYQSSGQNPYDVRVPCEDQQNLCYTGTKYATEWLNKPNVMKALGAEVSEFDSCNYDINRSFGMHGDWMLPIQRVIPGLLEKIPVLLYAGDADFICNWLGNLYWADALEWKGQKGFKDAEWKKLKLGDEKEAYGDWKKHGNFAFFKIFGGGHMVPYDQPEASLDFFNRWIGNDFEKKE